MQEGFPIHTTPPNFLWKVDRSNNAIEREGVNLGTWVYSDPYRVLTDHQLNLVAL